MQYFYNWRKFFWKLNGCSWMCSKRFNCWMFNDISFDYCVIKNLSLFVFQTVQRNYLRIERGGFNLWATNATRLPYKSLLDKEWIPSTVLCTLYIYCARGHIVRCSVYNASLFSKYTLQTFFIFIRAYILFLQLIPFSISDFFLIFMELTYPFLFHCIFNFYGVNVSFLISLHI